jgi:hypothetical protein
MSCRIVRQNQVQHVWLKYPLPARVGLDNETIAGAESTRRV